MSDSAYESILRDVLDEADRGGEPKIELVRERHPGHETTVEHVFAAFSSYRNFRASLARAAAPPLDSIAAGERLGDFEIVDLVGSGGMGAVYRARQLSLGGRLVALKVVAIHDNTASALPRFEREALAVAALHHAHLAEVYGFGEARGMLFYAMRLVDGPTLRSVLEVLAQRRAQDSRENAPAANRRAIVERMAEIADALAAVHAAGLVHRDVKPENIVLEGANLESGGMLRGSAVLVDFGLVRPAELQGDERSGTHLATPSYAAPEQLLGREVGARSDVFGLGVTMHDLLAARMPRERVQASAGLERIDALVPDIDPDLAAVVSKAVDPTARWRYADAAELGADLRAWLAGRPVSARRLRPVERTRRWIVAHPSQVLRGFYVGLFALAMVLLVGAYGRYSGYAHNARIAREQGNLGALFASLERVPEPLDWIVLRDRELVDLARRLRSDGWIAEVKRALDANDMRGALEQAATQMRLRGLAHCDPLATSFLIAQLRSEIAAHADTSHGAPRGGRAPQLVARLMYERPDATADDVRASAPLRAAVLDCFRSASFDRRDRLYLLTALSGCGRPEDIDRILEWSSTFLAHSEEQRLALCAAERIVRRAHACASLSELDRAAVWKRVAPLARELASPEGVRAPTNWQSAVHRVLVALALARKDRTDPDLLLHELQASLDAGDAQVVQQWSAELVALRDPRMAPVLAAGGIGSFAWNGAVDWGCACGIYDDRATTVAASAKCNELSPAVSSDFARGLLVGQRELGGVIDGMAPDANTCLGAIVRPEDFASARVETVDSELDGVDARWTVTNTGVEVFANACGFAAQLAQHTIDGPFSGYVLMSVFGGSEVRLKFRVNDIGNWGGRELRVVTQNGARIYYPFEGVVLLSIELNGATVADQLLAHATSLNRQCVDLPLDRLVAGDNLIVVRLHEDTTTTARFGGAEIGPKTQ